MSSVLSFAIQSNKSPPAECLRITLTNYVSHNATCHESLSPSSAGPPAAPCWPPELWWCGRKKHMSSWESPSPPAASSPRLSETPPKCPPARRRPPSGSTDDKKDGLKRPSEALTLFKLVFWRETITKIWWNYVDTQGENHMRQIEGDERTQMNTYRNIITYYFLCALSMCSKNSVILTIYHINWKESYCCDTE